jgi:hypothetical protein
LASSRRGIGIPPPQGRVLLQAGWIRHKAGHHCLVKRGKELHGPDSCTSMPGTSFDRARVGRSRWAKLIKEAKARRQDAVDVTRQKD